MVVLWLLSSLGVQTPSWCQNCLYNCWPYLLSWMEQPKTSICSNVSSHFQTHQVGLQPVFPSCFEEVSATMLDNQQAFTPSENWIAPGMTTSDITLFWLWWDMTVYGFTCCMHNTRCKLALHVLSLPSALHPSSMFSMLQWHFTTQSMQSCNVTLHLWAKFTATILCSCPSNALPAFPPTWCMTRVPLPAPRQDTTVSASSMETLYSTELHPPPGSTILMKRHHTKKNNGLSLLDD